MCLAVPMQIVEINQSLARARSNGIERDVNLFLLQGQNIGVGDYVMVHVGYAIQKVNPQQARSAWQLFDEVQAEVQHEETGDA